MSRVRLERGFGDENAPRRRGSVGTGRIADVTVLDHRRRRGVALEVIGVQLDATNHASPAETDDGPIVPGPAPPLRFPPVAHMRGASRHDEILAMAVMHVATEHDESPILHRREIGLPSIGEYAFIRNDVAMNA